MRQLEILETILNELKQDRSIFGIMLMGSVADGTATEESDLDLFILSDIDKFEANFTNGIFVEYIYMKYETALYKLQNKDMEVYRYINSRILYDNGQLKELMESAYDKFNHYKTGDDVKKWIYNWLFSVRLKLQSALKKNNALMMNYLTATSSWKVIESVWSVNNKPVPPSGSVIKFITQLSLIPYDKWFDQLFLGSDIEKARNMLAIIDWVLPILKSK
jgi:predicted nucleotidyltransferase